MKIPEMFCQICVYQSIQIAYSDPEVQFQQILPVGTLAHSYLTMLTSYFEGMDLKLLDVIIWGGKYTFA